jgi:HEAT repeat protein
MMGRSVLMLLLAGAPLITAQSFLPEAQSAEARAAAKGDPAYQQGLSALDARNWDQAIALFGESAGHKGSNADAALYWLAYAQNRAGRREEALATIKHLQDGYASSRWNKDAQALAVEIRGQNGNPVSPAAEPDEDLKLLALNSLMASDPDKAMPILRKLLLGNQSDKLKDRAMFVLVQNSSPEARKLLGQMARNNGNPDLQMKAIRYMGMMGGEESRAEMVSIYSAASDQQVKRAILRSLAIGGGKDELWKLYSQENSIENKKAILQSMLLTADSSRLAEVARGAQEPELKIAAIKSLGLMGSGNGHGDMLVSIFQSDPNAEVRGAVLNALFIQQNAKALVDLARAEKDPQMKAQVVQKLALIHSKESTDYMLEILK